MAGGDGDQPKERDIGVQVHWQAGSVVCEPRWGHCCRDGAHALRRFCALGNATVTAVALGES